MALSDINAIQTRKARREVAKNATVYPLNAHMPEIEGRQRSNAKLVGPDISNETEVVYQRFAPRSPMGVYHVHRQADNIWIVLQGEMEAIVGAIRYRVKAGEMIFMPSGVAHATGNPGGDLEMHAVEIYVPPPDHFEPRDAFPAQLPEEILDAGVVR